MDADIFIAQIESKTSANLGKKQTAQVVALQTIRVWVPPRACRFRIAGQNCRYLRARVLGFQMDALLSAGTQFTIFAFAAYRIEMASFINPYTDFGFKKLFGEEANKDLLIDFLNCLLPSEHQIASLTFKNTEQLGEVALRRKSVFDIYCISKTGIHFVVEMQKAKMDFFKDRSLFYATFPIQKQAPKGKEWDFRLNPVYLVAVLDFEYDENEERRKFLRSVQLKDQDGDLFYDKLHFKFVQMPLFTKKENELETHFDKWLYFLKNLSSFDKIPKILKEPIFQKAFKIAEVSNLTLAQYEEYERSMLEYYDISALKSTVRNAEMRAIMAEEKAQEQIKKAAQEARNAEENARILEKKLAEERLNARSILVQTVMELHRLGLSPDRIAAVTKLQEKEVIAVISDADGR
jgi:predicted transposase/invertase (TIGR01784 family)